LGSRVNQLEAEFREKFEEINTKIISKNQHQEKEIEVLKTLLEEEKKFSNQLSGRISQLEASTNPNSKGNDKIIGRPKRPYRLLPPHIPMQVSIIIFFSYKKWLFKLENNVNIVSLSGM